MGSVATAVPGLRAFEPEDAGVFFGRDVEIKKLMLRLQPTLQRGAQRLIAVVGPSGSGKSSMVKGGLLPRLVMGGWWCVVPVVQPGEHPMRNLARSLARVLNGQTSRAKLEQRLLKAPRALVDVAEEIRDTAVDAWAEVLLVIDQAEELATLSAAAERDEFVELLQGVLVDGSPLWAVATVRSEFLDSVLSGSALSSVFNEPTCLVISSGRSSSRWFRSRRSAPDWRSIRPWWRRWSMRPLAATHYRSLHTRCGGCGKGEGVAS